MAQPELKHLCHLATSGTNPFPACGAYPNLEDSLILPQTPGEAAEITCLPCRAIAAARMSSPEESAAYLNALSITKAGGGAP